MIESRDQNTAYKKLISRDKGYGGTVVLNLWKISLSIYKKDILTKGIVME